jgi:hypothetical protein
MPTPVLNPMTRLFDQLNDTFNETLKASVNFQEQGTRFWKNLFEQAPSGLREQFEKLPAEVLPFSKASVDRFQRLFDTQAERTVELMHETFELGKAETPADLYGEMLKLWRQSFDVLRESNEAYAKTSAEIFEQFSKFASTCGVRTDGKSAPKAAK